MPRDVEGYRFGTWILNEGLLRDEGTACGLTADQQGIESKLNAIRAFYELEAVRAGRERTPLVERLEDARTRRTEARAELDEARGHLRETEIAARRTENEVSVGRVLLRQAPTMLLAVTAAGCSYVLIREALVDDFASPLPVAVAVLLGGSFTLFRPVSALFGHEDGEGVEGVRYVAGWHQRLIELAPPLVAALFTCVWLVGERAWGQIVMTAIFLFTLFLFSGKLALSTLAVVARSLEQRRTARAKVRAVQEDLGAQKALVAAAEENLRRAEGEEARAIEALAGLSDRAEADAVRDYKTALFLSEVAFASGAKKQYQDDLVDVALPAIDAEREDEDP